MYILAVNAGSSSLKFALYPFTQNSDFYSPLLSGVIEGLEASGPLQLHYQNRDEFAADKAQLVTTQIHLQPDLSPFQAALQALKSLLNEGLEHKQLSAIAHRVVHGGVWFRESVIVTQEVLQRLETLHPLAPLHQPHNLQGIRIFSEAFSQVPQIACFDTAFHQSLPEKEFLFGLPMTYAEQGIRRYGFHGLSYEYIRSELRRLSTRAHQRVVMAHLGNGASLCAMHEGNSMATTMGFSAVEGLMMGTRSGALDPGVLLHLLSEGKSLDDLTHLLYKESGLLGISGLSADMRALQHSQQPQARLAIDVFTHRVVREMGAMTACLSGLDVLVFTGGIGEHDIQLRWEVCHRLQYLGVVLDPLLNTKAIGDQAIRVDAHDSRVEIWVIPTDEGRMAALSARTLLEKVKLNQHSKP